MQKKRIGTKTDTFFLAFLSILFYHGRNGCCRSLQKNVLLPKGVLFMSSFLESCFQEHYPFYSKLTADEQQTLVLSSVLTTYQRGDFLYSCDDDCLGVLLVLSGKLQIGRASCRERV